MLIQDTHRPLPEGGFAGAWLGEGEGMSRTAAALSHDERITVLVADGRADVREAICAALAAPRSIRVAGRVGDSGDLIGQVEKVRPDVVVLAVRMALRAGLERVARLLRTQWGAEVLVLLPHRESAFVKHIAVAGAAGFLSEQDSPALMAEEIRRARGQNHRRGRGAAARESLMAENSAGVAGDVSPFKETTRLSPREREVLVLIAEGNANKQIAARLALSIKTVEKHRQSLMDKLGIHETATLTRYAVLAEIVA